MRSRFALASLALTAALFSNSASAGPVPSGPQPVNYWLADDFVASLPQQSQSGAFSFGTIGTSLTGSFSKFDTISSAEGQFDDGTLVGISYFSTASDSRWGIGYAAGYTIQSNGSVATTPAFGVQMTAGYAGEYAVTRFTAQFAGSYSVDFGFAGFDAVAPTASSVYVLSGGSTLYSGSITGFNDLLSSHLNVSLLAGQSLEFVVGGAPSASSDLFINTTGLNLSISGVPAPVPEPATYAMFGAGLLALGAVARRRRDGSAV